MKFRFYRIIILNSALVSSIFLIPIFSFASSISPSFNYQGRILNADGTAGLSDIVDITLGIYDPSGNCLLYEETQPNLDLTETDGLFSLQVGSATGSTKRNLIRDPNLAMATIFSNSGTQVRAPGATDCSSG